MRQQIELSRRGGGERGPQEQPFGARRLRRQRVAHAIVHAHSEIEPHGVDEHELRRLRAVQARDLAADLRRVEHHARPFAGDLERAEAFGVAAREVLRPLLGGAPRGFVGFAASDRFEQRHVARHEEPLDDG